jgi:hypothetical protein
MVLDAHGVPVDSGYGTTFNHVIWIVKAMSDTTSFLGGAALAGLVAVVVLRGGISFGSSNSPLVGVQPGFSLPSALPNMGMNPNMPTVPLPMPMANPSSEKQDYDSVKLQFRVEQLQGQVEQQQAQLRSQQVMIDTLSTQSRTAGWNAQPPAPVAPSVVPQLQAGGNPSFDHNNGSLASGLPWALGGVLLAFGGGIALVGMFSLFSRQGRPGRTIEFVHDDYSPYLPQRRRVQVLPPRRSIRRIDVEDED